MSNGLRLSDASKRLYFFILELLSDLFRLKLKRTNVKVVKIFNFKELIKKSRKRI